MILVGIGANLAHDRHGAPRAICEAGLAALAEVGVRVVRRSRWYHSAPVPLSDQPWYVNGVAAVECALPPDRLLAALHGVEDRFGRVRSLPNAARTLDLDLLAYDDQIVSERDGLRLPHPRLHQRAFVLFPLAEVAPDWRHPATGMSLAEMTAGLPDGQEVRAEAG